MKTYILTIAASAVLSSFASVLSPDSWRKYIGVITGMVIISCIIAPLAKITSTDMFSGFYAIENPEEYSRNIQNEIITEELTKRINEDIELRLRNEFGTDISADTSININDRNEITGINKITVKGAKLGRDAVLRLCEVYGLSDDKIENE